MAFHQVIRVAALLTLLASVRGQVRIIGGQTATEGSWPWMVSLHNSTHFCAGSLINQLWVLTSARCVSSFNVTTETLTVYLGRQSLQGSNPNEVNRTVALIIVHPDFNAATNNNDIALLKFTALVNLNTHIQPVKLAAPNSTFHTGVNLTVTGWGNVALNVSLPFPQNLTELVVPVVGNRRCGCSYGVSNITDNMMCAGFLQGGKGPCFGDGGNPLVINQNGTWIQAGIASFGQGCAEPNFPAVYTRVSQYQSWINSQIPRNQPGFIKVTSPGTDSDLSVSCTVTISMATTTTPATSKPVVCGEAPLNSRILGGSSVVKAGEWPWMASLQKNGQHVCGGTLVSQDFVLSNANCFSSSPNASEWTVVLGRLNQNGSNPNEVSLNVLNITLSNLTGSTVNIAVLKLSNQPNLNNFIQPICLDGGQTFKEGSTCWAAGWSSGRGGVEQVLQEFQTSVQPCVNVSTGGSICTGQFSLEQGDSGGPLMCVLDGSWFQSAVLTFTGSSARRKRQTGVQTFEKLSNYKDFLTSIVGQFLSPRVTSSTTASANTNVTQTTSGGSSPHSFILLHILAFILCLQAVP